MPGPFSSEIPKVCARLETALNELIAAETQLNESLSHPAATDISRALDQVKIARFQCHLAAEGVLKLQPQTDVGKIIKRELVAVYLAMADLDQLELFAMLGPNLLSQCGYELPEVPTSSTRPRSFLWTARLRTGLPAVNEVAPGFRTG